MEEIIRSASIFLSVFGFRLGKETNSREIDTIEVVDKDGNVIGSFIHIVNEGLFCSIKVHTCNICLNAGMRGQDSIYGGKNCTIKYEFFNNQKKEVILGNFVIDNIRFQEAELFENKEMPNEARTELFDPRYTKIKSTLEYYCGEEYEPRIIMKSNSSLNIFSIEGNEFFIRLSEVGPNAFIYIENGDSPSELITKKECFVSLDYDIDTYITYIFADYKKIKTHINLPYIIKRATWSKTGYIKSGDTLKREIRLKHVQQIEEDCRGNIIDVINVAAQKDSRFYDRINEVRAALTIGDLGDVCIFDNLNSLIHPRYTEGELISMFGSDPRKLIDTPILKNGELVLPEDKWQKAKSKKRPQ